MPATAPLASTSGPPDMPWASFLQKEGSPPSLGILDNPHRPIPNLGRSRSYFDRVCGEALVEAKSNASYDRVRMTLDVYQEGDFPTKMRGEAGAAAMFLVKF